MRFTCDANVLLEGLRAAANALPARAINPVLDGVLIDAGEDGLVLTCSDERMTISARVDADVQETGAGVAPGRLFAEVIKALSGGAVRVEMDGKFRFTVRGEGGSRTNIAGQDANLFPELPEVQADRRISLPEDVLVGMIDRTAFSIAVEDMREVLTGAYLKIDGGDATMVGLDGFRMAVCKAPLGDFAEACEAIIPYKSIMSIGKLLTGGPEAFADIAIGGGKLRLEAGAVTICATLLTGPYIDYSRIAPKSYSAVVTADVRAIRQAVDRAVPIIREGQKNLLILRARGHELAVDGHSPVGDVHEIVDVAHDGEDIDIAFNVRYVLDVLKNVRGDAVKLMFSGAISPCIVTSDADDGTYYLMLPVRTSEV